VTEEWKAIPGYEGMYEVSNWGRVRSFVKIGRKLNELTPKPRFLTIHIRFDRYQSVDLTKNRVREKVHVHRLVAKAFIGPIGKGMHVAHLDGNPSNNDLTNLRICSPKENESHKKDHGTYYGRGITPGQDCWRAKLRDEQVIEMRDLSKAGWSQQELADRFSVTQTNVSLIVRRKTWSHI